MTFKVAICGLKIMICFKVNLQVSTRVQLLEIRGKMCCQLVIWLMSKFKESGFKQ